MHADGSKGGVGWLNNPTGLTMVLGAERVARLPPCMVREHPSYLVLLWSHCFSKVISMVGRSTSMDVYELMLQYGC
jgi:hypothetical protein